MAEEFQTGICSQNWWDVSSRSVLGGGSSCSATLTDISGSYSWPTDHGILGHSSSVQEEWNQPIFNERATEKRHNFMLHDDVNSKLNYQQDIGMDTSQIICAANKDSTDSRVSCTEASNGFPIGNTCSSTLTQSSITNDLQESFVSNQYSSMSCESTDYGTNPDELSNSWPKFSSFMKISLPNLDPAGMDLSENKQLFKNCAVARASFLPSSQSQFLASRFVENPRCPSFTTQTNSGIQDVEDNGNEHPQAFKRPRIESPSPLPNYKVRKEKLGDRITALQQLVSPFGKTDTASVLHEAIIFIKVFHDQVNNLSTPYTKSAAADIIQQDADQVNNKEEQKQDLKSRGLCLVPISSTFPVGK